MAKSKKTEPAPEKAPEQPKPQRTVADALDQFINELGSAMGKSKKRPGDFQALQNEAIRVKKLAHPFLSTPV